MKRLMGSVLVAAFSLCLASAQQTDTGKAKAGSDKVAGDKGNGAKAGSVTNSAVKAGGKTETNSAAAHTGVAKGHDKAADKATGSHTGSDKSSDKAAPAPKQ